MKPTKLDLFIKDQESPLEPQVANALINPAIQACNTIAGTVSFNSDQLDTLSLFLAIGEQAKNCANGNNKTAQEHLASQAITLNTISNDFMRKAYACEQFHLIEGYMKLAFKAQAQARQAWEALSAIQNPPLAHYVGQQNVAYNQQINNGPAQKNQNTPNELMENRHEQRLDTRAQSKASRADQEVEAVGKVHRTKNRRRKSNSIKE